MFGSPYLQLFVKGWVGGGLMSYLPYLCLFTYSGLQLLLYFSSSCVPYVVSFSGLSIVDCLFGIL